MLEDNSVYRALEDLCELDTVLGVDRQDLIAIPALETCYLHRSSPTGRSAYTSDAYTLVIAGLVYVDKVTRREL